MKVAIIIPRLERLGPVLLIQTLVNSLVNFKDLKIVVYYLDKRADQSIEMSVPILRYSSGSSIFREYDIIHTNGFRPDLIAFLNRHKIKYHLSTIHNFVFDDLKYTYNRLVSFIFGRIWLNIWRRADKLVCPSESMRKYYLRWFKDSNLDRIYNGMVETGNSSPMDIDLIRKIDEFHTRKLKVCGIVGVLTNIKGIDQVLRSLTNLEDYALIIIGSGREQVTLQNLARKLKIEYRCHFGGFRKDARIYLRHFDYFIMPSRSEGFGLALMEAVLLKVPVICSDIAVFSELFNNDEVTFFKLEDTDSLSEAMKISEDFGKQKTELAYKRFLNNYTAEIMANAYYKLYQSATL